MVVDEEQKKAEEDDTFWFATPTKYSSSKKFYPTPKEIGYFYEKAPQFLVQAILEAVPHSYLPPGEPDLLFRYYTHGRFPNWILIWIMRRLSNLNPKTGDTTNFYKAINLAELLRANKPTTTPPSDP